jgi:hypothetical protein
MKMIDYVNIPIDDTEEYSNFDVLLEKLKKRPPFLLTCFFFTWRGYEDSAAYFDCRCSMRFL